MRIAAIDPGTEQSAMVIVQCEDLHHTLPRVDVGRIVGNQEVLDSIYTGYCAAHECVIEMISCYGQRVGREVFETCVWIGRFAEAWRNVHGTDPAMMVRRDVKMELCNTNRAKDADVRAALIDLYGPGKDKAVGLKKTPGPLYGVKKDMWAALGVAVTYARQLERAA